MVCSHFQILINITVAGNLLKKRNFYLKRNSHKGEKISGHLLFNIAIEGDALPACINDLKRSVTIVKNAQV